MFERAGHVTIGSIASESDAWETARASGQAMVLVCVRMCGCLHFDWTCFPWVWLSGTICVGALRAAAWMAVLGM